MTNLPNLHDGFFDGVLLSADKGARFFVRTATKERFTISLSGVEALNISGLKQGNIIFDLVLIPPDKLTLKHVEEAYALKVGDAEMSRRLLNKAQEQGLFALEINSSYGAEGTALFRAVDTVPQHVVT